MPIRARRLLLRLLRPPARGALQPLRVLLAALALVAPSAPALADVIVAARYTDPTDRYAHGILGDAIEWGALELEMQDGEQRRFVLPGDHVFEDVAPRLADLDGDGAPEVLVVEADVTAGAAFAIYGAQGKITETPHIGTRNRWLAPLGAADLDGDGVTEIAYIDRPHLAKTLRIWRFEDGMLTAAADLRGLTNHRIGEVDIAGGIRTCAGVPEMILATANWSDLVAIRWDGSQFQRMYLGTDTTRPAFARAMGCQ
ncbi:VCBS repeat-containing protein [uncultured Tateyamaria sp.]|uniref:FG-GAP repeat domain-containing protein n=1 Tax=uncultured Tateyamaria sp. TaxID=455651 RepID=UPI002607E0A0|nr:VCBS repeat-containing protein [uncultured Tateyamaria sp.]